MHPTTHDLVWSTYSPETSLSSECFSKTNFIPWIWYDVSYNSYRDVFKSFSGGNKGSMLWGYWTYSFYTVILGNCGEKLLRTTYKYLSLHWVRGVWDMQRAELHILYILTEWSSYVYLLNMDCISSVLEQNEVAMVTVIFILKNAFILSFLVLFSENQVFI